MRWLDGVIGHEFGQTPGESEAHGSLVCCSSCDKESDMTERLNKHRNVIFYSCNAATFTLTIGGKLYVHGFLIIIENMGSDSPNIMKFYCNQVCFGSQPNSSPKQ